VANVVEANILAGEVPGLTGEAVNVACAERITVNQLIARINANLGAQVAPLYDPPRPGDILHSFAAIDKAKTVLGYTPRFSFDEGLKITIQWYKERTSQ
jgi:nucleoside-diphosphate-sugar epimerase